MSTNFYLPDTDNIQTYYKDLLSFDPFTEAMGDEIASELLAKPAILDSVKPCVRVSAEGTFAPYRTADSERDGLAPADTAEEQIAIDFYKKFAVDREEDDVLGHVLDYQMPLDLAGCFKAAMVCYNHPKDTIYILDVVTPENDKPLIASVLESYTYLKMLDKDAFVANMNEIYPEEHHITKRSKLKAVPLLYRNPKCRGYREYFESFSNVHVLMDELNIEPVFL